MLSNTRTIAFIDGQNLFYSAKEAFGYSFPNYHPTRLAQLVCSTQNWELEETRFYTGYPSEKDNPIWHRFWSEKTRAMRNEGVVVELRHLRYRLLPIKLPTGEIVEANVGVEKGIDVKIALDLVRMTRDYSFDNALIFSQDQDLSEAVTEMKSIAREQNRFVVIASAYPLPCSGRKVRGVNATKWLPISKELYDKGLDERDYRGV